jgi:hypothetical protein
MTSISFVITTSGKNDTSVAQVINNIQDLKIPDYEILIVGGDSTTIKTDSTVRHVAFDENSKSHITLHGRPGAWTTRKKNLGVESAQKDVVVVMHDYILFRPDWWVEFEKFGTDWDICIHQSLCSNGARGDGWRVDRHPMLPRYAMVPYDMIDLSQYMAIQGNYVCIKRTRYLETPMNENLLWGEEEEMEWSKRIVPKSHIQCNPNCVIIYGKPRPDDNNHIIDYQTMLNNKHIFDALRACRMGNFKLIRGDDYGRAA